VVTSSGLTSFTVEKFPVLGRKSAQDGKFLDSERGGEFVPEFTADVGIKRGEKVDYAILLDGEPVILVEAKWRGESLDNHASQLFRYFTTTKAKFGILTNGLEYRFYTDLAEPNKMDLEPFLEFDILDIQETLVPELKRFAKPTLDIDGAFIAASELKYMGKIKDLLNRSRTDPSDSFVKFVMKEIYAGNATQKAIEEFRPIIKRAFNRYINDAISSTLQSAMKEQSDASRAEAEPIQPPADEENEPDTPVITLEEIEAFAIVKSILRDMIDVNRLSYRHTQAYMVIDLDSKVGKRVCRLWLRGRQQYITTPDENKVPVRHDISNLNDIYNYSDFIREACSRYL